MAETCCKVKNGINLFNLYMNCGDRTYNSYFSKALLSQEHIQYKQKYLFFPQDVTAFLVSITVYSS
jgi:hypothetical protein